MRGADADVYAQRLNAAGVPQWAANGVALCTAVGARINPRSWAMPRLERSSCGVTCAGSGRHLRATDRLGRIRPVGRERDRGVRGDRDAGPTGRHRGRRGWSDRDLDRPARRQRRHLRAAAQQLGVAQWTANGVALCNATGDQTNPPPLPGRRQRRDRGLGRPPRRQRRRVRAAGGQSRCSSVDRQRRGGLQRHWRPDRTFDRRRPGGRSADRLDRSAHARQRHGHLRPALQRRRYRVVDGERRVRLRHARQPVVADRALGRHGRCVARVERHEERHGRHLRTAPGHQRDDPGPMLRLHVARLGNRGDDCGH